MLSSRGLVVLLAIAVTVNAQCTSSQFRCDNGQCTSSSFRCNGYTGGCRDGSDERGCSSCQSGAFLCSNRQCIRSSDRCDGTRDCADGSDETGCNCPSSQFQCATSGRCVSSTLRCNGIRTCNDGSDEMNCISCRLGAFQCSNRQCIPFSDRCDGTRECIDGSDETGCISCSGSSFRCTTGSQCIPFSGRCNGTRECTDGSDETRCTAGSGDLRLARGTRTSASYTSGRLEIYLNGQWGTVCNDLWDSTNSDVACRQLGYPLAARPTSYRTSSSAGFGSGTGQIWLDDVNCRGSESRLIFCSNRGIGSHNCAHFEDVAIYCTVSCSGSSFQCSTGSQCIPVSGRCNGIQECTDGSDETNCTCTSSQFRCDNGQCVSSSFRCNGISGGCSDGSDERGCSRCTSNQFRCDSGDCVSSSFRCNGRTGGCTDGSDERGCSTCSSGAFLCSNGQCIRSSDRCDGTQECTDGSDETGCITCSSVAFRCSNRQCIRSSGRCNGTRECTDGSDESNCSVNSGELRLAQGTRTSTSYSSGRLEIYLNGQWGTVCDDGWDSTNSDVACRQLGYSLAARPTSYRTSSNAGFGTGTGQIWLDDVNCQGTESRLTSCSNRGIGSNNCDHSEDVAVYCAGTRSVLSTLSTGTVAGISISAILIAILLCCFIVGCCCCCYFCRHSQSRMTTPSRSAHQPPVVQHEQEQQQEEEDHHQQQQQYTGYEPSAPPAGYMYPSQPPPISGYAGASLYQQEVGIGGISPYPQQPPPPAHIQQDVTIGGTYPQHVQLPPSWSNQPASYPAEEYPTGGSGYQLTAYPPADQPHPDPNY